jgi:hypothetical protein
VNRNQNAKENENGELNHRNLRKIPKGLFSFGKRSTVAVKLFWKLQTFVVVARRLRAMAQQTVGQPMRARKRLCGVTGSVYDAR